MQTGKGEKFTSGLVISEEVIATIAANAARDVDGVEDLGNRPADLYTTFKIGAEDVDDVVDGIMSKINIIGNTRALNNSDIVEFLTRSSSAMAEANNSLEDTIALGTAAVEITRDSASVGNALKTNFYCLYV